jgi:hypothetical protein
MARILRSVVFTMSKLIVLTACGFISVFVLASGYESVYSRSLPFVHTVDPVDIAAVSQGRDLLRYSVAKPSAYGQFGKPVVFKMPGTPVDIRLDVAAPIANNGQWLARTTALHAIIPGQPKKGNISQLVLYCRSSFRTISDNNLPKAGANIFIDTDQKWRYVYKVTSARTYSQDDAYVPIANSAPGKLLVACNDQAKRVTSIIEADLLSVQGAEI